MGTYLSQPVLDKCSEEGEALHCPSVPLAWGVVDMQGWRKSMEDAHVANTDVDPPKAFLTSSSPRPAPPPPVPNGDDPPKGGKEEEGKKGGGAMGGEDPGVGSEAGEGEDDDSPATAEASAAAKGVEDDGGGGKGTVGSAKVFAVFDGHGGPEVARFCQLYLVDVLTSGERWRTAAPPAPRLEMEGKKSAIPTENGTAGEYAAGAGAMSSENGVGMALVETFHAIDRMIDDPFRRDEIIKLKTEKPLPGERRQYLPPEGTAVGEGSLITTNPAVGDRSTEEDTPEEESRQQSEEKKSSEDEEKAVSSEEPSAGREGALEDADSVRGEEKGEASEAKSDVGDAATEEEAREENGARDGGASAAERGGDSKAADGKLKEGGDEEAKPETEEKAECVNTAGSRENGEEDGGDDEEEAESEEGGETTTSDRNEEEEEEEDEAKDDDSDKAVGLEAAAAEPDDLDDEGDDDSDDTGGGGGGITSADAMVLFKKLLSISGGKGRVTVEVKNSNKDADDGVMTPKTSNCTNNKAETAAATPLETKDAASGASVASAPPPAETQPVIQPTRIQNGRQVCNLPDHPVHAGCTSVVAVLIGRTLTVANAGDSRAVLCRKGGFTEALSFDHKPLQDREMNRITDAGGFVNQFGRVNGNLNLSRSIGDLKYKQIPGIPPSGQMITAEPDIIQVSLNPMDEFIIIGCDGIWDCLTNEEAVKYVRDRLDVKTPTEIGTEMLDEIVSDDPRASQGIGGDNMTIMIVDLLPHTRAYRRGSRGGDGPSSPQNK